MFNVTTTWFSHACDQTMLRQVYCLVSELLCCFACILVTVNKHKENDAFVRVHMWPFCLILMNKMIKLLTSFSDFNEDE